MTRLAPAVFLFTLFAASLPAQQSTSQSGEVYRLEPTPKTVAWGHYDAKTPPVLRIKSGDAADIRTLISFSPDQLEAAGAQSGEVEPSLRDIYREVQDKGPGGHILTGPIYVEGAEPGDVLEVQIEKIALALPYAFNTFLPGRGFLPDDFPYVRGKIIPLDERRMIARFGEGIEIPLRPFFGSMGVAPPEVTGRISSVQPWIHGGNLDNKDLVVGSTLFLPVYTKGALFLIGDGHAGQGDGEVDLSAMETSLSGTLRFFVRKDMHLLWPRAETPTHYVTMGLHEDLNEATRMAVREMIDFLTKEKHLTREDAYMLASIAADLHVTQLVDGNKGVHMMIPKAIFRKRQ